MHAACANQAHDVQRAAAPACVVHHVDERGNPKELAGLISDVAALSTKLHKPLSARLFLIPGKKAGDRAEFDNPFLTSSVVMKLD